jgi:hypothetical protein
MDVLIGFILSVIQPLFIVLMTGRAVLGSNLKFWPRLAIRLLPPFIGVAMKHRRRKLKVQKRLPRPVSSEEIFDPVLQLDEPRKIKGSDVQFLARA